MGATLTRQTRVSTAVRVNVTCRGLVHVVGRHAASVLTSDTLNARTPRGNQRRSHHRHVLGLCLRWVAGMQPKRQSPQHVCETPLSPLCIPVYFGGSFTVPLPHPPPTPFVWFRRSCPICLVHGWDASSRECFIGYEKRRPQRKTGNILDTRVASTHALAEGPSRRHRELARPSSSEQ